MTTELIEALYNGVLFVWLAAFIVAMAYAMRGRDNARRTYDDVIQNHVNGQVLFVARWRLVRAWSNVWIASCGFAGGLFAIIQLILDVGPILRPFTVAAFVLLAGVFVRGLIIDDRRLDTLTNMLTPAPGAPARRKDDI